METEIVVTLIVGATAIINQVLSSRRASKTEEKLDEKIGTPNGNGSVVQMLTSLIVRVQHLEDGQTTLQDGQRKTATVLRLQNRALRRLESGQTAICHHVDNAVGPPSEDDGPAVELN